MHMWYQWYDQWFPWMDDAGSVGVRMYTDTYDKFHLDFLNDYKEFNLD